MERRFHMLTIKQVLECVHQGDWFTSIYLKDTYFQGIQYQYNRPRPVSRSLGPQWDLVLVKAPSEPLDHVQLKFLSVKTAAKRVNDLSALSVSPLCLQIQEDGSSAILRPNLAYTPEHH